MTNQYCAIHERDEPAQGAYEACQECGHVFMTDAELLDEQHTLASTFGLTPAVSADAVSFCPLCSHDL